MAVLAPTPPPTAPPPAPPRGWRPSRPVTALAVALVLLTVGTGAYASLTAAFRGSQTDDATYLPPVSRLAVDLEAGSVTLEPSADGVVHVRTTQHMGVDRPRLRADSGPDGVVLGARCTGWGGSTCATDYRIAVPPGFAVDVTVRSGPVTARGLTGPLHATTTGEIVVADHTGDVRLATAGTGDVTATGLRARTVAVDTGSGAIRLAVAERAAQVSAQAGSGDVDVTVPAGAPYRVDAVSPDAPARVSVPTDDRAADGVRARTDGGTVTVHPT